MSRVHFEYIKERFRDAEGVQHVKSLESNIVTSPVEMLLSKVK